MSEHKTVASPDVGAAAKQREPSALAKSLRIAQQVFFALGLSYLATKYFTSSTHQLPTPLAATPPLKFLTVPPTTDHTATVIISHGLGDSGHGWKPVVDLFQNDPALAHIKWVLPHAPIRKVTANGDTEMPAWYNVIAFGFKSPEDEAGMLESRSAIEQLITAEIDSGLDPSRIVLFGFSQGAAMSALTGLTSKRKLAGIGVLSGWLPLQAKFKSMASSHVSTVPVFWAHGGRDPIVKAEHSKSSKEFLLQELGIPQATQSEVNGLTYHFYEDMNHSTNMDELSKLKTWIGKVLPGDGVL